MILEGVKEPEAVIEEGGQTEGGLADGFKKKKSVPTTMDSVNICLFTNTLYESFEKNLEQMKKNFGFHVLYETSCKNKEKLIKYLAKMIQVENICIYCGSNFKSADSTQKHLLSKQHTEMNEEYFGQYERFYDFREENRKIAMDMQERFKHVKTDNQFVYSIKNKEEKKDTPAVEASPEEIEEDGDWEDDQESESGDSSLAEKYNIRKAKRLDTGELLMPSGRIAGNRDYIVYYKQHLKFRDDDQKTLRQIMNDPSQRRKAINMEQALVLKALNMDRSDALSLRTYNNFLINLRKRADKANYSSTRRLKNDYVRLGIGHNKLQKHFRDRNVIFA